MRQVPAPAGQGRLNWGFLLCALALLVGTLVVYELALRKSLLSSVVLANLSPPERFISYALLLLAAVLAVAYDWSTLGPTLALRHGVAAAMVSWLLLVPFGAFAEVFIHSVWFVAMCGLGLLATVELCRTTSRMTSCYGATATMALCLWLGLHGGELGGVEDILGTVFFFCTVYVLVRSAASAASEALQPIKAWPGLSLVEPNSAEYREQLEAFKAGCAAYQGKYKFALHTANLYRVSDQVKSAKHGQLTRTQNGRSLFHGTRRESALGIIQDGFRLPSHPGMFGKGIYFADCPLKSWQYTDGVMHVRNGIILLCWVELGKRPSHQKAAQNTLTRPPRRSLAEWLRGEEQYTSVVGDDQSAGGALRVPEYIIYEPAKVQVDYVCEVECGLAPSAPCEE